MTMLSYGTKLSQIRIKSKLSQQEVADYIGVSRSTYSKWESDQCIYKVDFLIKLAEVFNVHPLDLLPVSFSTSTEIDALPPLNSELFYELIQSKNEVIALLKEQIGGQPSTN